MKNGVLKKLIVLLVLVNFTGCVKPIFHIENGALPASNDGKSYTTDQVKEAILVACKSRGWSPIVKSYGVIEASISVRTKHQAVIKITYTAENINIHYVSSENLKYSNGKIHRNYNKWISLLYSSIKQQLGVRAQMY